LEKVYCSVRTADSACSDEEKALIAELRAKTKEELVAIVESAEERSKAANEKYEAALEELQASYERITTELNDENEAIRTETHVKWVHQILNLDHPDPEVDDEDPAEDEL
jgi:F0F1-type ATP synthase membrane subunit b/b'